MIDFNKKDNETLDQYIERIFSVDHKIVISDFEQYVVNLNEDRLKERISTIYTDLYESDNIGYTQQIKNGDLDYLDCKIIDLIFDSDYLVKDNAIKYVYETLRDTILLRKFLLNT